MKFYVVLLLCCFVAVKGLPTPRVRRQTCQEKSYTNFDGTTCYTTCPRGRNGGVTGMICNRVGPSKMSVVAVPYPVLSRSIVLIEMKFYVVLLLCCFVFVEGLRTSRVRRQTCRETSYTANGGSTCYVTCPSGRNGGTTTSCIRRGSPVPTGANLYEVIKNPIRNGQSFYITPSNKHPWSWN